VRPGPARIARSRIAIDAHSLGRGQAGYESYLRHLTAELPAAAPEAEFVLYLRRGALDSDTADLLGGAITVMPVISTGRARRLLWDLPTQLRRDRIDLLHVQYAAPFPCPVPVVATIHDLSFVDVPHFFSATERALLRIAVGHTARMARRVVTVSEFSKRRLMSVYGLDEERVVVAPNAAGPNFHPARPSAFTKHPVPYVLMVGDLQPRKNHIGAIRAFAAFAGRHSYRLLIAGRESSFGPEIHREAAASGAGDRIDFLGYVPDSELPELYRGASCCLYPSFYEGFGLPVLEAMACGTPVVTSRGTALEEVAGGAAILAAPDNPREIAAAIAAAIDRRADLSAAGLKRAGQFSWGLSARETVRAFREALAATSTSALSSERAAARTLEYGKAESKPADIRSTLL
jgi:glycosyltransferase involved in cell wall biosynthesis